MKNKKICEHKTRVEQCGALIVTSYDPETQIIKGIAPICDVCEKCGERTNHRRQEF